MTTTPDTLTVDQHVVDAFTRQAAYDYNREIVHRSTNYLESFFEWLNELFVNAGDSATTDSRLNFMWWIAGAAAVVLLIWWLQQARFKMFRREEQADALEYDVELAGLHDIDYVTALASARAAADHNKVCRLLYLLTLKRLSDAGSVDWRPFKTPTQYAREVNDSQFTAMTNSFLRIRYGNFDATLSLVTQMEQWHQHTLETITPTDGKKGGEAS